MVMPLAYLGRRTQRRCCAIHCCAGERIAPRHDLRCAAVRLIASQLQSSYYVLLNVGAVALRVAAYLLVRTNNGAVELVHLVVNRLGLPRL